MKQSKTMEEARKIALEYTSRMQRTEEISIYEAVGRVAAKDYTAWMDQPPFDRSPLDGFALRAGDILEADKEHPVTLQIEAIVYAGEVYEKELPEKKAIRIMTGAPIPKGADCVVRIEDVSCNEKEVSFFQPMKPHDNICDQGEDLAKGNSILKKGEVVTPSHGAVLTTQGFFTVEVYKKCRIAVLSTGSELTEPKAGETGEQTLLPGKIFNSNGPMVALRLAQMGMIPVCRYCKDDIEEIVANVKALSETTDCIITTGGVSVGDKDYMPAVMESLGAQTLFHGIAMKPGSPMLTAQWNGKMIFSLSGNPFAASATLELIAIPSLLKMAGFRKCFPQEGKAVLADDFLKASKKGRRFIRAKYLDGKVWIPKNHSSGSIASSIGCNCLIDIKAGTGALKASDLVDVIHTIDIYHTVEEEIKQTEVQKKNLPVICITGQKKTGKTTAMKELIHIFTQKGYRVAAMKHDGHDFVPDVPGTDSYEFREAGAKGVSVFSENRTLLYWDRTDSKTSMEQLKQNMEILKNVKPDLVLVEGMKSNKEFDKIEIIGFDSLSEKSQLPVSETEKLIAVIAQEPMELEKVKCFPKNEMLLVAEWILKHCDLE